jgi:glucose-1-phosphate cytidylyltransferase
MKSVILAGGMGTRLREETEYRPKPMVEIGGRPILWHIMKNLSCQNLNEFVICLGYKGDQIKDYFLNYATRLNDITIQLNNRAESTQHSNIEEESWRVTLANTGSDTMTGGRIYRIRSYVKDERFLCTYGDGLADVSIEKLLDFHLKHRKIATVTAVRPTSRFGAIEINSKHQVERFTEKPRAEKWVNGGFFIFEPEIFNYLNDDCILEKDPLENLAKDGQLMAYQHSGYWQPMDTYRETLELNELWQKSIAPWKKW